MSKILDEIYEEIERYNNIARDPETPEEQEYVDALWLAAEMLAETRFVKNDPGNWSTLDEDSADWTLDEKPGDKVYRYPLSYRGEMGLMLIDLKDDIGGWIAGRRSGAGLTRYALAKKLGCQIRSVSQWETGKQIPGFDKIVAIYKATR